MNALKVVGGIALWLAVVGGMLAICAIFFMGAAYASVKVLPWLMQVAWLAVFISVLSSPLALFKGSRVVTMLVLFVSSYVYGLCLWLYGFLVTYSIWGFFGVAIGLFIFGIGVAPVAALAALVHGMWSVIGELALLAFLCYGSRLLATILAAKVDADAEDTRLKIIEAE